jgi:hypothetical protein
VAAASLWTKRRRPAGRVPASWRPGFEIVPERMPARTQAGNLTLRKLSKTDRAALYTELVLGQLLVTLREAFAVAPGIAATRAVVLQDAGLDAYGRPRLECLVAGALRAEADESRIVEDTASELVVNLRTGKQPVELSREPEIQALISLVDVEELLT